MDRAPVAVLERNARWLAVAKPAGLAVIPTREGRPEDCLRARVEGQLGQALWVVHRIDRETSGVVVFACDADAHRALNLAFERHQVGKTYLAWCAGAPQPAAGSVSLALHSARKGKMRPAHPGEAGARQAHTDYCTEQVWPLDGSCVSRLRCQPRSGRQHQIRVHLRHLGTPILADPLYGLATRQPPFDRIAPARLALHAWQLALPAIGEVAASTPIAPLPADLVALQARLADDAGPR